MHNIKKLHWKILMTKTNSISKNNFELSFIFAYGCHAGEDTPYEFLRKQHLTGAIQCISSENKNLFKTVKDLRATKLKFSQQMLIQVLSEQPQLKEKNENFNGVKEEKLDKAAVALLNFIAYETEDKNLTPIIRKFTKLLDEDSNKLTENDLKELAKAITLRQKSLRRERPFKCPCCQNNAAYPTSL